MHVVIWNGGIKNLGGTLSRYVGPYKIAHWLRKHGYLAQIIDFVPAWTKQELYTLTKKFISPETKILAVSTTFLSLNENYTWSDGSRHYLPENAVNVLRIIKKERPDIKLVMGGYKSDLLDGFGLFDATVMSYTNASEDIFLEYLEHLVRGTEPPIGQVITPRLGKQQDLKSRIHYDNARNKIYNIENDDFRFIEQDCVLTGEALPLDVSKGCIFACRFCQYPHLGKGKLDYIRGMEYLEQELRNNYEKFGTTSYYILDDTFNDTEIKLQAFYDMTQRLPFKISYTAYIRADLIDSFPNTAHLLKESGCFGAFNGIETFHPEASKLIGKGWSGRRAKEFLPKLYHDVWKRQVLQHTNFIIGITGETRESVLDSVKWYTENNMYSVKYIPLGLFGNDNKNSQFSIQSEFDRNAEKYGYKFNNQFDGRAQYWYNDQWTAKSAANLAAELNTNLNGIAGVRVWALPGLQWYGYTQEELRQTTQKKIFSDAPIMREKTLKKLKEYYNLLLSI